MNSSSGPVVNEVQHQREARWHSFQVVFGLAYAGVVLVIVTTAIGIAKVGFSYERNPLTAVLIHDLTWVGVLIFLSAFAALCYVSVRIVCLHMSPKVTSVLTALLGVGALARWTVAAGAVLFIMQTH
jgi:hypothetical protein